MLFSLNIMTNHWYNIVCLPIRLDFLFITFLLYFFMSWTSSLPISSSAISASTLANHVLLGLPTGLLPSTLNFIFTHCCCCLPTPMTLASGGSSMFLLVAHQPVSPSILPAVHSLRWGLSTNPRVTMWCVCGCS